MNADTMLQYLIIVYIFMGIVGTIGFMYVMKHK